MTLRFIAYVDEAGDEGLGKLRPPASSAQSKWLSIGGIVVSEEDDKLLPAWRDGIMALFPLKKKRDLHFKDLNHDQRVATCTKLAEQKFKICVVCSNKITIAEDPKFYPIFKQKGYLYNYLTRYFLERITARCRVLADNNKCKVELEVRFSRRGGTDYQSMKEYLEFMRDGKEAKKPVRSIDWTVFSPERIRVENHSRLAGLQLADVVTSATASALEPNAYGHYEARYANILAKHYLARGDRILNTGLTLLPPLGKNPLDAEQKAFVLGLQEKWQAPGP